MPVSVWIREISAITIVVQTMNLTLVIIQEAHEAVLPRLNSLKFRPNTKGKSATCAVRAFHTSSEVNMR